MNFLGASVYTSARGTRAGGRKGRCKACLMNGQADLLSIIWGQCYRVVQTVLQK